jgi:hypothetical protein
LLQSHHQDTYTSVNKTFEKELKQKTEDLNRVKTELETLKKQYDEKDKFEKEILNNHQLNMSKNNYFIFKNQIKIIFNSLIFY